MSVKVFFCYAHEDEPLLNKLKAHLIPLQRQGLIDVWHDRDISAGTEWEQEIKEHLNTAQIILLLVSPDFMVSDYVYNVEMKRAMERFQQGEALVIPIIVRPVSWQDSPFGKLQALPTDANPVVSHHWHNTDEAFLNVAEGIRRAITTFQSNKKKNVELPLLGDAVAHDKSIMLYVQERPIGTLLCIYRGHPAFHKNIANRVDTLAWSPVGQSIASASLANKAVHVWNAFTGKRLLSYYGHSSSFSSVTNIAWSPDGTRIASSSDFSVHVWNASDGMRILTYGGHENLVLSIDTEISDLAWSSNGKYIASASGRIVQIWDANTGRTLTTYHGHSDSVYQLAWSPSSTQIASSSRDGTIQIWDVITGTSALTHQNPEPYPLAWSPDGTCIASAGDNKGIVIWNTSTDTPQLTYYSSSSLINPLAWSPNGKYIASVVDDLTNKSPFLKYPPNAVQIWSPISGESIFTYTGHDDFVYTLAWSPDSSCIVSAGEGNLIQVWKAL